MKLKKHFIFLDVDGTLVADGKDTPTKAIQKWVAELAKHNEIVVLSNKKKHLRNQKVANTLKLPYLHTELKKPSQKILKLVNTNKPLAVIGDKYWTDGRFAKAIGGTFIKVKRIQSKQENPLIKLHYFLDDCLAKIMM